MTLQGKIQSILFAAGKPVSLRQLSRILSVNDKKVEQVVEHMLATQDSLNNGIVLIKEGTEIELVTSPENAKLVERVVKSEQTGELTRPALETLSIIAYRSPITKPELEAIRGVNCSLILRNLMIRGLITEELGVAGVSEFRISLDFLRWLGVTHTSQLPDYEKFSSPDVLNQLKQLSDKPNKS